MDGFGGVVILGGIAAFHVPADQAEPQIDPSVAHFEAFLAALLRRTFEILSG